MTTLKLQKPHPAPTLADMIAARDLLNEQIDAIQNEQRGDAVAFIRAQMAQYGITVKDIEQAMIKRRGPRRKE